MKEANVGTYLVPYMGEQFWPMRPYSTNTRYIIYLMDPSDEDYKRELQRYNLRRLSLKMESYCTIGK